jgi:fumarate reductase subunit D
MSKNILIGFNFLLLILLAFLAMPRPAYAINPENSLLADPGDYFKTCTCTVGFLGFVVWAIVLLVIALFQYGEKRERRLSRFWFSIIAIIAIFVIYTIPLWTLVHLLDPANFEVNPETGVYEFSMYGEKNTDTTKLTGHYTTEELEKQIRESKTYIVTTWAIMSILCAVAVVTVPAYIRQLDKRREQAKIAKRKKRSSKGRIGTRTVKQKDDDKGKKNKKDK